MSDAAKKNVLEIAKGPGKGVSGFAIESAALPWGEMGTRVEALKKELIRDNVFDPRKLDNVLYYTNVEEQNMFLDSITNGQMFGRSEFGYWKDLEPVMYLGQALKLLNSRFTFFLS